MLLIMGYDQKGLDMSLYSGSAVPKGLKTQRRGSAEVVPNLVGGAVTRHFHSCIHWVVLKYKGIHLIFHKINHALDLCRTLETDSPNSGLSSTDLV